MRFPIQILALLLVGPFLLGQTPDHLTNNPARPTQEGEQDTALSQFILKNGGTLPKDLDEVRKYYDQTYRYWTDEFAGVVVPFSDAPKYTDLIEARSIFASPLQDLFIGGIKKDDGTYDIEFISWNYKKKEFDFGRIDYFGTPQAKSVVVDKSECIVCHKAHGPTFTVANWENAAFDSSGINAGVYRAFIKMHTKDDPRIQSLHQRIEQIYQNDTKAPLQREVVDEARKQIVADLKPIRWHGIDLNPGQNPAFFEKRVASANQVGVLHAFVQSLSDSADRKRIVGTVLKEAFFTSGIVLHSDLADELTNDQSRLGKALNDFPLNRSFLFRPNPLTHLGAPDLKNPEQLLVAHEKKRQGRLANTAKTESPTNDSIIFQRSKPLFGAGTFGMRYSDLVEYYRASLGVTLTLDVSTNNYEHYLPEVLTPQEMKTFLQSTQFKSLQGSDVLPDRRDFERAAQAWKDGAKLEHATGNSKKKTEFSPVKRCQDCHLGKDSIYPFPIDLTSVKDWEAYLSSTDNQTQARDWMESVISHLEKQTMPPKPFSTHLKPEEVRELTTFLKKARSRKN